MSIKSRLIIIAASIAFLIVLGSRAQSQTPSRGKQLEQYVVAPREIGAATIAVQPDAPLEFIDTQLLVNVRTGHWVPSFRLRNKSAKPLQAFTVAFGADELGWKADPSSHWLMPGEIAHLPSGDDAEIVPLSGPIREKLKLNGPMQGIMVLLVVSAEYSDQTRFEEKGREAMENYLSIVNSLYYDFLQKSSSTGMKNAKKRNDQ